MYISAKTTYACLAMLELGSRYEAGRPVRIGEIAQTQAVPARFLVQILLQLKQAGLVASTRGAAGGYHLTLPPDQVSLGQVMEVIDRRLEEGQEDLPTTKRSPAGEVLCRAWHDVAEVERKMLDGISLYDLLQRIRNHENAMYYI